MDPQVVLILTYVIAGAIVAGYIWFMIWRIRVDRLKKAETELAAQDEKPLSPLRQMLAEQAAAEEQGGGAVTGSASTAIPVPPAGAAVGQPMPPVMPPVTPLPPTAATTTTVIEALTGIKLPNDLAPLTTLADRTGVADRIAFWTNDAPADTVTADFTAELDRLGYTVADFDSSTKAAHRDGVTLLMAIYGDAESAKSGDARMFPSVPEGAVVVDVWIPSS